MAESVDTGTNLEQWIREMSPSLAFYSNSRGGGFIGKRALKSVLIARATRDLGREYYPQRFNEAWDQLLKEGFVQQLIERGKPKGMAGSSGVPSPISAKATTVQSEQISNAATAPLANGTGTPSTETIKTPSVAGLAKTTPLRFGPAVGGAGPATLPGLVTPGGSLTAETARELAAFGGAVIRSAKSTSQNWNWGANSIFQTWNPSSSQHCNPTKQSREQPSIANI